MIVIVDYDVGNLSSVCNMLRKAGAEAVISREPEVIKQADKLVLPGVGHFDHGMKMLDASGLRGTLDAFALGSRKPVLGICLGAQMLGKGSAEGDAAGLGWIDMECRRFPDMEGLRVPHMGWSTLDVKRACPLFSHADEQSRYYFVHSYYMQCANSEDEAATSRYGLDFTSVIWRGNIFGAQFHPEKSLRHGLALMRAFAELPAHE